MSSPTDPMMPSIEYGPWYDRISLEWLECEADVATRALFVEHPEHPEGLLEFHGQSRRGKRIATHLEWLRRNGNDTEALYVAILYGAAVLYALFAGSPSALLVVTGIATAAYAGFTLPGRQHSHKDCETTPIARVWGLDNPERDMVAHAARNAPEDVLYALSTLEVWADLPDSDRHNALACLKKNRDARLKELADNEREPGTTVNKTNDVITLSVDEYLASRPR